MDLKLLTMVLVSHLISAGLLVRLLLRKPAAAAGG